jgi:ribosomal protein S18 acetylase RimI-like enzyme
MRLVPLSSFRSLGLSDLFTEEREEWASRLRWDYREPQKLISAMLDIETLPGFVAMEDGIPVGYSFYLKEPMRGLIGACFVRKDCEGRGIEERLLAEMLSALKANPAVRRIESQFMNFRRWAISEFFARNGFDRYERCFMLKSGLAVPGQEISNSLKLRQWTSGDLEEAARLTVKAYELATDRHLTYHYQSFEACRDFLSSLILRPGCGRFLPEASYSARDEISGDLIGYVLSSRISHQDGHIPQIVVATKHQGKGAGSALLSRAIRYLGLNGYQTVSLSVTEANTAAMSLYARFGFARQFRFPAFVWLRSC